MALSDLSRVEVSARMAGSGIARAYEVGACDDATFCAEMVTLFELDMPATEFPALWNSWVHPPFAGVIQALAQLRQTHRVACLSNTNALHWAHLQTLIDPYAIFHHAFASQLIQAAKPDPESYLIPLKQMGINASEVHFFDDTAANVEAARAVGLRATLVDQRLGVLPNLQALDLV